MESFIPPYSDNFKPEEGTVSDRQGLEPQNIYAEKSVLSACFLDSEATGDILARLRPNNFYRSAHQLIFESIFELNQRNIPIDPLVVSENLKKNGQLEAIGGLSYLIDLQKDVIALGNWSSHVDIVLRTSIMRDMIRASGEITKLCYSDNDDLGEVTEEAEKILLKVTERRISSSFDKIDQLLQDAFDEITEIQENGGLAAGISTGFVDIDKLFHGLRGGDLIVLAARPGVGKTSFALNVAVGAAKAGAAVAFFSLEMDSMQLVQRLLCSEARVGLSRVRSGELQEADWNPLASAADTLSQLNIGIDDSPGLSILELRAKARRAMRGVEKGVIIIDYLQLMQPPKYRPDGNRAVEVGEISRGLKILAKELNMPVIALSQLNRSVEMRASKRPMLSDLRESGSIEQDADVVAFIDRSMDEMEAENDDRPDLGTAQFIVAKHRNGATRDIRLAFNPEHTRFMDFIDDSRVGSY